ncbi:hypothetical protein CALCODRAFT_557323 [Calocera cornea HHB12733]|uniref:Concanavalin A-like lectin/glucanase n=1 Tax=Calocera cornea HHB12733 TaxID=1353952 RepID=A0A165DZS5_9BASI|nr:hypothetical protein CALCODRAFT_557323 [Calocera cornea HHB12733]
MRSALPLLALACTPALAISLGLILPDSNVWTSLTFTMTVPPPPPPSVVTGPWFFWAGIQPPGGVVQPVLQWGEAPSNGWINNDNAPFPHIWQMVDWVVPSQGKNNDVSATTQGIWADEGAQIRSTVNYANGQWSQTSTVVSGGGSGYSVSETVSATQYFDVDETTNSDANFFVLESELYGDQIGDWNFDVTFTDITLTADTTDGVSALCGGATSHSDGNGFISITGFSLSGDGKTCHWDSMVLSPP